MRISDWSSDVCSSDLLAGQILHHILAALRPGVPQLQQLSAGLHTHLSHGGSIAILECPLALAQTVQHGKAAILDRILGAGTSAGQQHAACSQCQNDSVKPVHALLLHPTSNLRSEEHTSELQSLMRIS